MLHCEYFCIHADVSHIDSQIHCLGLTKPLLVLADAAVAEVLGPNAKSLAGKGVGKIYCWDSIDHLPSKARAGLQSLNPKPSPQSVEEVKSGSGLEALDTESDGMIMFTSGTTNLPKGVIVSQRACMTHVLASSVCECHRRLPADSSCRSCDPPSGRYFRTSVCSAHTARTAKHNVTPRTPLPRHRRVRLDDAGHVPRRQDCLLAPMECPGRCQSHCGREDQRVWRVSFQVRNYS